MPPRSASVLANGSKKKCPGKVKEAENGQKLNNRDFIHCR